MAEGSSDVPVSGTRSVYMSSDGDGDVEIEEKEDIASDLTETIAELSLASCGPCREKDKSTKDARWTCKDCNKHMCDDCNKMHDLFIKGHTVTKIGNKMCGACKQKDDTTTEASWYCTECDQYFCDGCNASHGIFLKNHKVRNVASGEIVQGLQKAGKNVKEATGQVRTKQNAKKADKDVGKSSSKTDGGPNTEEGQQDKKANSMSKSPQVSPFQQKSLLLNNKKDEMAPKRSIHLKLKTSIKTDKPQSMLITSVAFLPDERLLLVDKRNKTLTVYSHDFQFMEEKVFDQEPRDVAVYDSNEVSVSIYQQGIVRLSLTSGIKEKAYLSVEAVGLAYITENKLGVTQIGPDAAFVVISNSGEELLRVQTDGLGKKLFSFPWYVAVDSARSRAYVSDDVMGIVVAIELTTGRVDFIYQREGLTCAYGLDVDQEGYIYICQVSPAKIHRISPTRVNCGIFSDIPVNPFTLCFAPNKRDFIVTNTKADVALYTVV